MNLDELAFSDGDIGVDADQLDFTEDILAGLGLDDSSLELSLDDDESIFEFDESLEEEGGLSSAILLREAKDIVVTFEPYLVKAREAYNGIFADKSTISQDEEIKYNVNPGEFPYMDSSVFVPFHKLLLDMVNDNRLAEISPVECAEVSIDQLKQATGWSPGINRDEYVTTFCKWYTKFRAIAEIKENVSPSHLSNFVSKDELLFAWKTYDTNTRAFVEVTNFFNDAAAMGSVAIVDHSQLGEATRLYMEEHRLRQLSVRDCQDLVLTYLSSDDVRSSLGLSQDEILAFSTGELFRRMMLFELTANLSYPGEFRNVDYADISGCVIALMAMVEAGSIAAELSCIIILMMLATKLTKNDEFRLNTFIEGVCRYMRAYLEQPETINPIFYGSVKQKDDSDYTLEYAVGDKSYSLDVNNILCEVIGNRRATYCIPFVKVDKSVGCVVCPPENLVTPMRQAVIGGQIPGAGEVCFKFTPTISWLTEHKILAEGQNELQVTEGVSISGKFNSLLQTLMAYDNKFDSDGTAVSPLIVKAGELTLYSVVAQGGPQSESAISVLGVLDSSNRVTHTGGLLVHDEQTGNIVATLNSVDGSLEDYTWKQGDYTEQFLAGPSDEEVTAPPLEMFVMPAIKHGCIEYLEQRKIVQGLCELASLDYNDERLEIQHIIARDLYHIVGVSDINALLATNILSAHLGLAGERKSVGASQYLENFNYESVQELVDILLGKPNMLSDRTGWDNSYLELLQDSAETMWFTVDNLCDKLDQLDFDILALQALSRGTVRFTEELEQYKALLCIPPIATRLYRLEDKMITLRVLNELGSQMRSLFSKWSVLYKVIGAPVSSATVDAINDLITAKMRVKDAAYIMALTKKVVAATYTQDDALAKYFILERNLYALLNLLEALEGKEDLYFRLLNSTGLSTIKGMTLQEFNHHVSTDAVVRVFNTYREEFLELVYAGLISEVSASGLTQVVEAYDLFETFGSGISGFIGNVSKLETPLDCDMRDLYTYGGSFIISYCPVVDQSAGEIDGGSGRDMMFLKSQSDFIYDYDLSVLREYELSDLRIMSEGEQGG